VARGIWNSWDIYTWIAVIAGLAAKTPDGAGAFSYPLIFLPFISSAFVPTDTMPSAVRAFAENQPVTPMVEAIRNLLGAQPVGNDIWIVNFYCATFTLFFIIKVVGLLLRKI
jgi:ABC-2 type transport system permease protein